MRSHDLGSIERLTLKQILNTGLINLPLGIEEYDRGIISNYLY